MDLSMVIAFIGGIAIGMLAVGFLAVGAYDRGFADALYRRKDWRAELVARQTVADRTLRPAARKAS